MAEKTELLVEGGRNIFYDYPILEVIGWLVLAYVVIMFITFYVGPALYNGGRPYGGRPWWRRRRSIEEDRIDDDMQLAETVSNSIGNHEDVYCNDN